MYQVTHMRSVSIRSSVVKRGDTGREESGFSTLSLCPSSNHKKTLTDPFSWIQPQRLYHNEQPTTPTLRHRVLSRPLLRKLIIPGAVILVLLRDAALHRIIRHGLHKQLSRELQHGSDLRARLPLVGSQHPQTHAPLVIVRHVGVVDLGSERYGGRLERVLGGEFQLDEEVSILYCRSKLALAWTVYHSNGAQYSRSAVVR